MAKKNLSEAYIDFEVEYINDKISKLSHEHFIKQHHLCWENVKDLLGKNSNSSLRIKGESAKKRLKNWSNHFKNILGKDAKLPDNISLTSMKISDKLKRQLNSSNLQKRLTLKTSPPWFG